MRKTVLKKNLLKKMFAKNVSDTSSIWRVLIQIFICFELRLRTVSLKTLAKGRQ